MTMEASNFGSEKLNLMALQRQITQANVQLRRLTFGKRDGDNIGLGHNDPGGECEEGTSRGRENRELIFNQSQTQETRNVWFQFVSRKRREGEA